jgi:hypothetical protein
MGYKFQEIYMNKNWPTKDKDMYIARLLMEEYAMRQECESLGLLEVVVNQEEKSMNFRMSSWVLALAQQFNSMYGALKGDFIMRQVISKWITEGQVMH